MLRNLKSYLLLKLLLLHQLLHNHLVDPQPVEDLPDDYEAAGEGVIVSKVDNSSNSATKILEGDVITDIQSGFQRYSVKDSDSFNDIVSKFQSGDKIAIFGLRENSRFIVPITVD